ncbi:uncharacterized protein TNCV_4695831 [Trichonephila clavipes]|nr:uncharacterized protein TNCV_4695831 [Trichonephila clavipes]
METSSKVREYEKTPLRMKGDIEHASSELENKIVRVQYFVRGGFVGHRSRVSSKHLSSHLPVDGVRFLGGQKGVARHLQDARVGVGSTKDFNRCWVWLRYNGTF